MENQQQKWVLGSFLAFSALIAYVLFQIALRVIGFYDLEAKIGNIDTILPVVSIVVGGILFLGLYNNTKSNQFMTEVVLELSRVSWPGQKETSSATVITIVMVVISGLVLGLMDFFCTQVMKWIL